MRRRLVPLPRPSIAFVCSVLLAVLMEAELIPCSAADVDFDRQIRPILSENCFHCHGPDEATRQGDLRLDTAAGALADRGGYAAIVPNEVDTSELIKRVLSTDPDLKMPPPDSKLQLTPTQIDRLRQWVQSGAKWSEHWSFVTPTMPMVPHDPSSWSRNEIDRFIRERAIAAGLTPQAAADKETLIRRVTLDLTGVPPTLEEIDAFLADDSDDAYETLVDRLLASPRYGERMAWEWLDAARYADTDGFQGDPTRTMWPWRDWLVDALNNNMPFDQFTIEMLAGDLIPSASAEQVLATGFNRNHMFNGEGGRIAEETRVENVFDRAETTATIWLGLTMTCCRCHDHKYDPLTQNEYFQLYAFFNNTSETGSSGRGKTAPVIQYLPPEQDAIRQRIVAQLQHARDALTVPLPALDAEQAAWEIDLHAKLASDPGSVELGPWWQLGPIAMEGRQSFEQDLGPEQRVDLDATVATKRWSKPEKLTDGQVHSLPETIGATYFYRRITATTERSIQVSLGSDDAMKVFVDGKALLSRDVVRGATPDQDQLSIELNAGSHDLLIKVVNTGGIGGFYFKKTSESLFGLSAEVIAALRIPAAKRSGSQRSELQSFYRSRHWPEWPALDEHRQELEKKLEQQNKQAITVMVMDELPPQRARQTLVLQRGGYDKPTEIAVQPGTPAVLPALPTDAAKNRLTLAKWLVDPQHPLTARVTVNRYWQTFFGRGIVDSAEDFGSQGNRPTHPELLDALALRFIASGWDVKQMHKLMVMSATYRQSAMVDEAAREIDPENRLLARAPRFRLPSWMLRDQALAAAGLLSPRMGGVSVKPYQPEGVWSEATFGKIQYFPDSGDDLYRRSVYVFWRRIVGPTMFFDGAKRQTCEVKPTRTNTPLHALTTLNETTFVEASRMMAQRVMARSEDTTTRIHDAFRIATARMPNEHEFTVLDDRLKRLRADFADHPDQARQWLSVGQSAETPTSNGRSFDPAEHAAFAVICSILLNLDESLSRQ